MLAKQIGGVLYPGVGRLIGAMTGKFSRNVVSGAALALYAGAPAFAELPVPASKWVQGGRFAAPAPIVNGNTLNINQLSQRGILHWDSFNIGAQNVVNFNQPDAASSTLNRVVGNSLNPSRILGQLNANGQVLIINQNGIVFGDGAQVNVGGLVASTLDVSDQVYDSIGIVDALQQQLPAFEARELSVDAQGNLVVTNTGVAQDDTVSVIVEDGAVLRALGGERGGRIMLFAPTVENRGTIETPDGQAMLAASRDKVYLARLDDTTNALLVEVDTGGSVSNLGKIVAERGDITLMGLAVNQQGTARASTAVSVNGSIHLLARDRAVVTSSGTTQQATATRTGTLTLGKGSVTEVALELDDGATAIDDQAHSPSEVELMGQEITFEEDAALIARNGNVSVLAVQDPRAPLAVSQPANSSRLVMEKGARIDVSGETSTIKSVGSNVIEVELRGNQLADSPVQKNGPLRGENIRVDVRKGTPIANIDNELAGIPRTLGERAATGGSVTLGSEGDLIVKNGATIDVSGGLVTYEGGQVDTTFLVTSDLRVVNIADASPDTNYRFIFGQHEVRHDKWGVTEVFGTGSGSLFGQFEPGYVEGRDAGQLTLLGRNIDFQGDLLAQSVAGINQRSPALPFSGLVRPFDQVPLGGRLVVGDEVAFNAGQPDVFAPEVVFTGSGGSGSANAFTITPELLGNGVSRVAVYSNGLIKYAEDADFDLGGGGEFVLGAGQIEFDGTLTSAGGQVVMTTQPSGLPGQASGGTGADSSIVFGDQAVVDTSGVWVNDNVDLTNGVFGAPLFVDGGSVTLESQGDILLADGSQVLANAGAYLADGEVDGEGGNGGDISIAIDSDDPASLQLGARLEAFGFGDGGSLSLQADGFRVADAGAVSQSAGEILLSPDFFTSGGFSAFDLTATRSGIFVEPGVNLTLSQENRVLLGPGLLTRKSGSDISDLTRTVRLPDVDRKAVDLALTLERGEGAQGASAIVEIGDGARIQADPGANIKLASDSDIRVFGDIEAPAGRIELNLKANSTVQSSFDPGQAIWIGSNSTLSTRGAVKVETNQFGQRLGEVLDAGTIALNADNGFIVAEAGSVLDVSGISDTLSIPSGTFGGFGPTVRTQKLAGAAGAIELRAADGAILDGDLIGHSAANVNSPGGSLSLSVDARQRVGANDFTNPGLQFPVGERVLTVTRNKQERLAGRGPGDDLLSASEIAQLQQGNPTVVDSNMQVSAEQIAAGGFGEVTLTVVPDQSTQQGGGQRIAFDGDVDLQVPSRLVLQAPVVSATPGATVSLASDYVAIGAAQGFNFHPDNVPNAGTANLTVNADFIDLVGDTTLDGIASAAFNSAGDIRLQGLRVPSSTSFALEGSLRSAGDLAFTADQIYPATLTDFTISAESAGGRVSFASGSAANKPLSAGGTLRVQADEIEQGGVLRAPFGEIQLLAGNQLNLLDGSETSVSGEGLLVPFGETQLNGKDWVFDFGNLVLNISGNPDATGEAFTTPPEKRIVLDGANIDVQDGSLLDLSGGGDLLAYEFVPGPGGSADILNNAAGDGAFAIVPRQGLYGAVDPLATPGSGIQPGDTIILAGGNGLPSGEFAILPARYALLPGAFLVTPETAVTDILPGATLQRNVITPVIAGKLNLAGQPEPDSRWSAFRVESGSQWRQRSAFLETRGSDYFADQAASIDNFAGQLPFDAGALQISALNSLRLRGDLVSNIGVGNDGQSGRSVRVDVTATDISVVNQLTGASGTVELLASDLNGFGAESLLIGGRRTTRGQTDEIETEAANVVVRQGVDLLGQELLLAAKDQLTLESGASVRATGAPVNSAQTLALVADRDANGNVISDGGGALLRASTGRQVTLDRPQQGVGAPAQGNLDLQAGSQVVAGRSISLQATGDVQMGAAFLTDAGGSLNIGASRISLGDTASVATGFTLDNQDLSALQVSELILTSATTLDLIGDVDFGADAAGQAIVDRLVIDAAGLAGYGNSGMSKLTAGQIVLANNAGSPVTPATDALGNPLVPGTGSLQLNANGAADSRIGLGDGAFAIQGYQQTVFNADVLNADGNAALNVDGDLTLNVGRLSAAAGVDAAIDVNGQLTTNATTVVSPASGAFGANLKLAADDIVHRGLIELPAGNLSLQARVGDVSIENGAVIDTSGVVRSFGNANAFAPGGRVAMVADNGDVLIRAGSRVDVSGAAAGGDAGSLLIDAPTGTADIAGQLDGSAAGGYASGSFELDVATLADFSVINQALNQSGFQASRDVRLRQGDLNVAAGDVVTAEKIRLTADSGAVNLGGTLDASGARGGSVELYAGGDLNLNSGARIQAVAQSAGEQGGNVVLQSTNGVVSFNGTTQTDVNIDVAGLDAGGQRADTGRVRINAARNGTGINVGAFNATVSGAGRIDLEAHQATQASVVNTALIDSLRTQTSNYLATNTVLADLGINNDPRFHVTPSIEVFSPGDLTVSDTWALGDASWRINGEPGRLTLRATNDLNVNASVDALITTPDPLGLEAAHLGNGESWSVQMVAGANTASANPLGTNGAGDFNLQAGKVVRTGTGDIDVVASGDIVFGDGAHIASIGENAGPGSLDSSLDLILLPGAIADNGGDIGIQAGGDITGVPTSQLVSDWQPRLGGPSTSGLVLGDLPTAWSIVWDQFDMNVGALGGGNVAIRSGGSVNDLSVAIATSGQQVGVHNVQQQGSASAVDLVTNEVRVLGGGDLDVLAGQDIVGGYYHVGSGQGTLRAQGQVARSGANGLAPVLSLGDASFDIASQQDLEIETAINPTIFAQSIPAFASPFLPPVSGGRFFSYDRGGPTAGSLALTSITGDVVLSNDSTALANVYGFAATGPESVLPQIYPGTLKATALQSDILVQGSFKMYPHSTGQLELLAGNTISTQSAANVTVDMLDTDPQLLPSIQHPVDALNVNFVSRTQTAAGQLAHAATPVHLGDTQPVRIYAANGDVASNPDSGRSFEFFLPKPLELFAGRDVNNVLLHIQHNTADDRSVVQAGRDVIFPTRRAGTTGKLSSANGLFEVSGPGGLDVLAARDVDLGSSVGFVSLGNDVNAFLPEGGANITVIAGLAGAAGYSQFTTLPERGQIADLTAFMRNWRSDASLTDDQAEVLYTTLSLYKDEAIAFTKAELSQPGLSDQDALAAFEDFGIGRQNALVLSVLFNEVKAGGVEGSQGGSFERAYDAIEALYPENAQAQGQLRLLVSQVTTEDGGDINLLTPYGGIDAGVASTDQLGDKTPDELGILVKARGSVNAVVRDNLQVNATRVFTLDGGDILVWSSFGNIDAGTGANLAVSVPSREVSIDKFGVSSVKFPPAISSAGIRSIVNTPGTEPGDVFLFAPEGIINAGDAGIGAAGNLTLAATQVVGADNIDVGGVSVGVPTAPAGPPPGLAGVSALTASVTKKAQESAASIGDDAAEQEADLALLSIDVLGFGEDEQ